MSDIHTNNIRRALAELQVSAESFCILARISSTRWSRAVSGAKPLTGPECLALSDLIEELRSIANDATVIPLSFKNIEAVKRLLELRRGGVKVVGSIQIEEETALAVPAQETK